MKKLVSIVVAIVLTTTSSIVIAQTDLTVRKNKPTTGLSAATYTHSIMVSERISKRFEKCFPGITDAAWLKDDNGFVVRFTAEGIQNWALLSRQGVCYGRMRYYNEKDLPNAVRNHIEEAYKGFTITAVREVYANNTTTYLVTIADAASWKVIRVANGEADVREEYVKR